MIIGMMRHKKNGYYMTEEKGLRDIKSYFNVFDKMDKLIGSYDVEEKAREVLDASK